MNLQAIRTLFNQQTVRTMTKSAPSAASAAKKTATKAASAKVTKRASSPKAPKVVKPAKIPALDMPKRPSTSWNLFFMDHLAKVKATGKTIVPTDEGAAAAAIWDNLPAAEKDVYKRTYEQNYAEYKKQLAERLENLTPAEFKQENARRALLKKAGKKTMGALKDPNAPKRPLSSFFRFAKDQRLSGKYADLPLKDQARAFAEAWKNISESEKKRYTELSNAASLAYRAEKAEYEANA